MQPLIAALTLALLSGPAGAQTAPAGVCVPRAFLDQLAGYLPNRPWGEVAGMMPALIELGRHGAPCDLPKPAATPGPTLVPAPATEGKTP